MRLIIISNRAPVSIVKNNGDHTFKSSEGGLASGLGAYVNRLKLVDPAPEVIWIGWPGDTVDDQDRVSKEIFDHFGVHSVFLSEELMEKFYEGFCNNTIWPLFHYFPVYTSYNSEHWDVYVKVNYIFCEALLKIYKPGDVIWIQDYHLMLLPAMIRNKIADASIGFFLHIPFPSYEVFRLLPSEWRKQILEGLYGADLIGFHTFDYRTYFLRSTLNILGMTEYMGEVKYKNRLVKVDSFPMGIDFDRYHNESLGNSEEKDKIRSSFKGVKLVLSIDRQDYTKGILNRLKAYELFLNTHPEWKNKVTLLLVVVPSRIGVESYQSIKSQIDELVGHINGLHGSLDWQPINYQYRSLSFPELIALYNCSDVALITPLRDGMNLIVKEFIASRTDANGVVILSEMTGAAQELHEAIIINPNNLEEISNALLAALEMNQEEQQWRIETMQRRVKLYNIFKWADEFLLELDNIRLHQFELNTRFLSSKLENEIITQFKNSKSAIFFLDYDGTLVEHTADPTKAIPDEELLGLLNQLSQNPRLNIIIISGRDKGILNKWFGNMHVELVAEHGVHIKEKNKNWRLLKPVRKSWKKKILPVMNMYVEKLPGAFVEQKDYSLVFHYRKSNQSFASLRVKELTNQLISLTSNMDLQILPGSKILEIRNSGIDKGLAALNWLNNYKDEMPFILAIGNDVTDEELFRTMPPHANTIIVGSTHSYANYFLNDPAEVRSLLKKMVI